MFFHPTFFFQNRPKTVQKHDDPGVFSNASAPNLNAKTRPSSAAVTYLAGGLRANPRGKPIDFMMISWDFSWKKPDLDGDIMGFVPWWYHGIYILQYILQYILPYLGVAVEVVNDFFSGEITPGWDMCSFYDC